MIKGKNDNSYTKKVLKAHSMFIIAIADGKHYFDGVEIYPPSNSINGNIFSHTISIRLDDIIMIKMLKIVIIIIFYIFVSACANPQLINKEEVSNHNDDALLNHDYMEMKEGSSPEETEITGDNIVLEERISDTLQEYANTKAWFRAERTWEFHLLNKVIGYEYYTKEVLDRSVSSEGYYDDIAVLLVHKVPTWAEEIGGPLVIEQYHILAKSENSWNGNDIDDYRGWYADTIEECRVILQEEGYHKLGEGTISFGPPTEPDYGEATEEKFELVLEIATLFMNTIGSPDEISELYILDFSISSDHTQILYVIDDVYWETQLAIGYRYFKPHSVSEFDDDGYYRSQFKKIAFSIDISDKENLQIISSSE